MSERTRTAPAATTTTETSSRTGSGGPRPSTVVSYVLLVAVAIIFVSPLVVMVSTSLKLPNEVFATPPQLVGSEIRWQNYVEVFDYAPFWRYLANGVFVAALGTLLNLVACALSGYAFARLAWAGREMTFGLFVATLMVPQEVLVVPAFVLVDRLGWVNSYEALIIPWAFSAMGAFLLRQFFVTVPRELDDAARVDGSGVIRTFFSIMLPLARSSLAVLAVFTFIAYWNSFLWPLIVINDVSTYGTIPLGLQQFVGQQGAQFHLQMAASVISMVPTIVLLLLLQKHLVRGIVTSGLGGR